MLLHPAGLNISDGSLQVQSLLDEGVFDNERYKEGGWVTDLWYEDQVLQALKERTGGKPDIIRGVCPSLHSSSPASLPQQPCTMVQKD